MRRSVSSRLLPVVAASLVISSIPLGRSAARTATSTASADTSTAESGEAGAKPGGRVKISIDESGISIEGRATVSQQDTAAGGQWVEVYDGRGRYREKGLDIVKFGESVFVARDELVRGDLVVFGGNAMIEGRVGGNVVVIGGDIRARSGAVIKGDAVVIGGTLDEDDDVVINGERVTLNDIFPAHGFWFFGQQGRALKVVLFPVGLFVQLVLAFLILLFLGDRIKVSDGHLSGNYLKSLGVGVLSVFIGVFGLIVVTVTLFITLIGIPLALLLWVSCAGVLMLAWTVFAYSLGRLVAGRLQIESDSPFLMVLLGAVAVNLPSVIAWGLSVVAPSFLGPLSLAFGAVGWFVKGFAYLCGIGALITSRFGGRPLPAAEVVPPPPTPTAAGA